MFLKRSARIFLMILSLLMLLCACASDGQEENMTTAEELVTEYAAVVTSAQDLADLDIYPNLKTLDLRGSRCYNEILEYAARHPEVQVIYDVLLGGETWPQDAQELTLTDGRFTVEELIAVLPALPQVRSISLSCTGLSLEDLERIGSANPEMELTYSVMVLDQEIASTVDALDISQVTPEQLDNVLHQLQKLPKLTQLNLMDVEDKSMLDLTDVKKVMDAFPEITLDYTFTLFGKTLSVNDERVEYTGATIGDEGVAMVRQALDIMPKCTYFLMDQCGVSYEVLDQLNQDYPNTKIVWRVFYGGMYSSLTDETVVRCVGELTDGNSKALKYMTETVYLDAGHCYYLTDLSFVSYMPNLKVGIFSDCGVSDLTPFESCKKLEYVEFVNCNNVKELTSMAECESLKGINLSWNFNIKDLDPLYGLEHLERLFCGRHGFADEEIEEARAALPDCWVTGHSDSVAWIGFNYSVGWRLDDEHTFAEWYKEIKEVFGYTREIY